MRLLWMSNAPWANSGYGQQTLQMLPRLRDAGHDVAVFANYGLNGSILDWDGFRIYPAGQDGWGNDVVELWADDWRADQIITLYDTWTFEPEAYSKYPTACWTPIDHTPVPPKVNRWFKVSHATPIAMSQFGRDSLTANDLIPQYAPHGIDTNIYQPRDKHKARRLAAAPDDCFLIGMVGANIGNAPARKGFDLAFRAFRALREMRDDVKLYVHAEMRGARGKGLDLAALATQIGISADDLWFADQKRYQAGTISPVEMSYIYSALDVLISPSLGEGFGIPVIEAQACGIPVIVSNGTAQTELCGAGWLTRTQPLYDGMQAADWHMPLLDELTLNIAESYIARGELHDKAVEFAQQYDADRVFADYWLPVLKQLEDQHPSVEPLSL